MDLSPCKWCACKKASGEQSSNFALLHLLTLTDAEGWGEASRAEPGRKQNSPTSIPKNLQVLFSSAVVSLGTQTQAGMELGTPPNSNLGVLTLRSRWCSSTKKVEEIFGCLVVSEASKPGVLSAISRYSSTVKAIQC